MDWATLVASAIAPLIQYGIEAAKAAQAGKVEDAKAFLAAGLSIATASVTRMIGSLSQVDAAALAELDAKFGPAPADPLAPVLAAVHARADEVLAAVRAAQQPAEVKVDVHAEPEAVSAAPAPQG